MTPTITVTDLATLAQGYRLCARTEGKSKNTIEVVTNSLYYFEGFLRSEGLPTDVTQVGVSEIRAFILYLQRKRRFSGHPFAQAQQGNLSGHTVNCYLRSIRAFWSWLVSEEIISGNPFAKVKLPKAPIKVVPTFSDSQIEALLGAVDTSTPEGYRNYAIILALLDTALRVSELIDIEMDDLWLDEGLLKVMGKGGKERHIPIGVEVQRILWRYINRYRPQPLNPNFEFLFLTRDGRKLTKGRIETVMSNYGRKVGLKGVRVSPHTLRHTAAVSLTPFSQPICPRIASIRRSTPPTKTRVVWRPTIS